jgi:replication-associated recombination protein RarA
MLPVIGRRSPLIDSTEKKVAAHPRPAFLPRDLNEEWDLIIGSHFNVLLAGTVSATQAVLEQLRTHLCEPLQEYRAQPGELVPEPQEGTFFLLEADRLDSRQQEQLLEWLGRAEEGGRVQVVATTSEPLFSLVEAGAFLASLYYRLNVVRMDLTESGDHLP